MAQDKRLQILTESEINELYGLPLFTPEQRQYYFHLDEDELHLIPDTNDPITNVYIVLLLGYFKYKPIILNPAIAEIREDMDFIRKKFGLHAKLPKKSISGVQKSRIYAKFLGFSGHKTFDAVRHKLAQFVVCVARATADPREIFDACTQFLSEENAAIPAYSTLQKIISDGIHYEDNRLHETLLSLMSDKLYTKLQAMAHAEDEKPLITQIKQIATSFAPREIQREVQMLWKIKELFPEISRILSKLNLSQTNIQYYSSQVTFLTITRLRELSKPVFSLYLMCYLYQRHHQIGDILVNAMIHHVRKMENEAKTAANDQLHEDLLGINEKVKKVSDILGLFFDGSFTHKTPFGVVLKKAFKILNRKQMLIVKNYLAEIDADVKKYQWDYYRKHHSTIKNTLRKIFLCLDFQGNNEDTLLREQIEKTRDDFKNDGHLRTFDLRLIKPNLRPYLLDEEKEVCAEKAEMLLYIRIKERIENGQFFIKESFSYKSIEEDLVSLDRVDQLVLESRLESIKCRTEDLLQQKTKLLEEKLTRVNQRLTIGENPSLTFYESKGKIKFSLKRPGKDKEAEDTENFLTKLPQLHIGDIIDFSQRKTQFAAALTHVRMKNKELPDIDSVIACIVANGTRCGIYHMADLCNIPYETLRKTQKNHLRLETLHAANDFITNATARTKIFQHYHIRPNTVHASYDGQKFHSRYNTIRTRYSSKYLGRGKGLSAISLIANHIPINAKMMGLNEHESHHLYDVLYNNTSDIQPDLVSTDTHGSNQVNFALLDLSGWQYAPRYADPGKVLSDLFISEEMNGHYQIRMKKPISGKKILEGWPQIQRIMVSLENKAATQSTIVRKLSRSRKNTALQPLLEYDRLIKSLYMLDYLDDESLRRHVQRALNRGESYHAMQRRLEQVNGGKFRGGSDDEIDLWYECGRLICNCVIYFNSCLLSELLEGFEKKKLDKSTQLVKRCTPTCWAHVNFNGSYVFSSDGARLDIGNLVQKLIDRFTS